MAEIPQLDIDQNGIIQSGRFSGQHVSNVLQYAQSLEEAMKEGLETPQGPPREAKPDPGSTLNAHAAPRVDAAQSLIWQRLELDDEAEFARTVPDYEAFKEEINKAKQTIPPVQRIAKGLHKFLYLNVKAQKDEGVQRALFGKKEEAVSPPAPSKEEAPPIETETPPPPSPKPVPVAATPTPVSRAAAPTQKERKPKLHASDKVERSAAASGIPLEEYLLILEDQGVTQDQIDLASRPASSRPYRSRAYDRT